MTKIFCDYCNKEVRICKTIWADLDKDNVVYINIRPTTLNRTAGDNIKNPDLCVTCILKAIKERN